MQAKGAKASLLMDFETTYNETPVAPAATRLPINSAQLKSKQNAIESQTITGRRDPVQPGKGNIDVSGSIVVPLDITNIGFWLKAALGAPVTTGAGPYTHVFKPGDTMPSVVLQQGFGDIGVYELFNGCKIGSLKFNFGGDGELTVSIDVMGAKETIGNASFDDTPQTIPLLKFSNFQASVKEGGATVAVCTSIDLEVNLGLDGDTYVIGGNGFRRSINEGNLSIKGNIKALFENRALLDKAINNAESSIEIALTNGTNSLTITIPEVLYDRNSPSIDGPKGVLIEMPYTGYFADNAEDTSIKFTLVNSQATY